MLIYCDFRPAELYYSLHELVRLAFPGCRIIQGKGEPDAEVVQIDMDVRGESIVIGGSVFSPAGNTVRQQEYHFMNPGDELSNEARWYARRFTYQLLCQHMDRNINAYGILTGMRPVKLVHRLMDTGAGEPEITDILQNDYHLQESKTALLLEVARNNRPFLLTPEKARKMVSIYIGIPFCPSRCYYCSFPGAVLKDYESEIKPFLQALYREMNGMADCLQEQDMAIQSIYIGGGTPTVLSAKDLEEMLDLLHQRYITHRTQEITVEAGRPDTLNPDKLKILKQAGVDRICVNPQSMNDSTLQLIGRNHNQEGVVRSIEWVREAGIRQINMDLIVGLPGETISENTNTADKILRLEPENVTVHTLSLKRGSDMAIMEDKEMIDDRVNEVQKGVEFFDGRLREAAYLPYYMYRQKYMKAGMENTGYSLPGQECLYNIQMIEERQTIIGMGGGAASKFINTADWTLTSSYNPKDPASYCESIEKLIKRKVDKLWALN
ncbi:putative radical sam family enzyme, not coproporphyrinogen iii oxidase, oxygen-independent [hydrocarbon metagenome]|uniref:Putative radical sam family enzyme, not coproporphyrinogen iii oxidase, oxygen-independent n=1 Tax=hydrocarbon metagenome TaxID=938273 RepID=A0A0W8E4H3_9ZZZZ